MKIESLVKVGTLLYWGGFLSLVVVVQILVFVDFLEYRKIDFFYDDKKVKMKLPPCTFVSRQIDGRKVHCCA